MMHRNFKKSAEIRKGTQELANKTFYCVLEIEDQLHAQPYEALRERRFLRRIIGEMRI